MTTLKPPFRAENMEGLYKKVIKGIYPKIPGHFSQDLSQLIKLMLSVQAMHRPNCDKILALPQLQSRIYPFVKDISSFDYENQLLQTIKFSKNLHYLTDQLPKPNYIPSEKQFLSSMKSNFDKEIYDSPASNVSPSLKMQQKERQNRRQQQQTGVQVIKEQSFLPILQKQTDSKGDDLSLAELIRQRKEALKKYQQHAVEKYYSESKQQQSQSPEGSLVIKQSQSQISGLRHLQQLYGLNSHQKQAIHPLYRYKNYMPKNRNYLQSILSKKSENSSKLNLPSISEKDNRINANRNHPVSIPNINVNKKILLTIDEIKDRQNQFKRQILKNQKKTSKVDQLEE